ncbi:hypothetical protein [Bradyrhizobium sp. WSM471]|uniref:hypothetical protein n=1 Tax=Bradyrhizobium sp. WSM471 TaxID=319017 RepID=UPI00024D2B6C|nr:MULTISPECIES: hypothetical protein [Bradyrhizobium]EHR04245.1 hypothetical protein Bra471DRAFT_05046 [Bradyrhizobium sp. WSM471]UFW39409.1 hypothetical protein BcanWSM471_24735 [Bradyrhizobium canariense]
MRFLLRAFLIVAAVCVSDAVHAQYGAAFVFNEQSTYGSEFLRQPAAQSGLIVKSGCGTTSLTGRRSYLVKSGAIYWGLADECVRVIVNHRATDTDTAVPTYLGVQVIGFYDDPQSSSIVLRRKGAFVRDGKILPPYDDKSLSSDELDHDTWDSLHTDGTLQNVDDKVGKWHGTPQGGIHDSWDDRRWFRTSRAYDPQLQVKYKTLDNRLIRFTPYPANGSPQDGPLSFNVNRRGARVVVVRVFSPSNADYENNFALVYESDPDRVAQLVNNIQVVQAGLLWRIFR